MHERGVRIEIRSENHPYAIVINPKRSGKKSYSNEAEKKQPQDFLEDTDEASKNSDFSLNKLIQN